MAAVLLVLAAICAGSFTDTVPDVMHPAASDTMAVYIPPERLDAVEAVPPDGDQEYVKGAVPPVRFAVAAPLLPPKQETGDMPLKLTAALPELVTCANRVLLQLCESFTVTV